MDFGESFHEEETADNSDCHDRLDKTLSNSSGAMLCVRVAGVGSGGGGGCGRGKNKGRKGEGRMVGKGKRVKYNISAHTTWKRKATKRR